MEPPKSVEPTPASSESEHLRLWISSKWYIPVDKNGECIGACLEGALGFVVQLRSSEGETLRRALKLPRLLGETHRENAYISDLMEKELEAVQEVFDKPEGNSKGLLRADIWELGGPLRGQIDTKKGTPEALRWDGAIVLVLFEKGHKPRFCLVRKVPDGNKRKDRKQQATEISGDTSSEIEFFPEDITDCPVTDANIYDRLQATALNDQRHWQNTVFIDLGKESGDAPRILNKHQALQQAATGQTWFTCVPSIPYEWARGTLQEAISLGKRGKWGTAEHFSLARRVCMGIHALHSKRMLHADLRPANLVYTGEPTTPDSYYLCDYGSFAKMGARDPNHDPLGNTVLGPVAGTERTSPFYAPERRAGLEREAADTAVIHHSGGSPTLEILLGWRSELERRPPDKLFGKRDNEKKKSDSPLGQSDKSDSVNTLTRGDRIQIRDYIFDIISANEEGGEQLLTCRAQNWKIHQGRIVVENTEQFSEDQLLPIPRTIELQQWSAATDVYGLGALFLYSVYRSENVKLDEPSGRIEETFREMLTHLEGESYFNQIWGEVESLRAQLEANLEKNKDASATEFGNLLFRKPVNKDPTKKDNEKPTTLGEETIRVVQRITQTVPWSKHLVKVFDHKLGTFVFFIHFVLCCLHRQNHLERPHTELGDEDSRRERPFCKDRREPPESDGGARRALNRLDLVRKLIQDRRLDALKAEEELIPDYDPRPEPLIRIAYQELEKAAVTSVQQGRMIVQGAKELPAGPFNMVHVPAELFALNSPEGGLKPDSDEGSRKKVITCVPGKTIASLKEPLDELEKAIERSRSNISPLPPNEGGKPDSSK